MANALANPNGVNPDISLPGGVLFSQEDVWGRVPSMLRYLAAMWAGLAAIAICLVRRKEQESPQSTPLLETSLQKDAEAVSTPRGEEVEVPNKEAHEKAPPALAAVKSRVFWHIFGMILCSSGKNSFFVAALIDQF